MQRRASGTSFKALRIAARERGREEDQLESTGRQEERESSDRRERGRAERRAATWPKDAKLPKKSSRKA